LTFARGLRSICRHDPTKIHGRRNRDQETAQIAIQSALTGHLVFTTVHATTSPTVSVVSSTWASSRTISFPGLELHPGAAPRRVVCRTASSRNASLPDEMREAGLKPKNGRRHSREAPAVSNVRAPDITAARQFANWLDLTDRIREMIIDRADWRSSASRAKKA